MKLQINLEIPEGQLSGNDEKFLKSDLFNHVSDFMSGARQIEGFDYSLECTELAEES